MPGATALPRFPFDIPACLDAEAEPARLLAVAGPVVRAQLSDGAPVWVAIGHEAVRKVLTDSRFSRAANARPEAPTITPGVVNPDTMLNMDPPGHTRRRRLVAGAFSVRVLEQRRPRIEEITDGLLNAMEREGPPADLVTALAFPLPIHVLCDLLGMPYEHIDRVREWTEIIETVDGYPVEEVRRAANALESYVAELVGSKRGCPADDLTTMLIHARDENDRLSERELVMSTVGIMVAGHETTANFIATSLLTLFRHPDQLALLRAGPELVPNAVEELLRFTRLLRAAFGRVAKADVELEGVTVAAGDTVYALPHAANRDERVYSEPDRLDVTREGSPHLAFGHGPHTCLGAPLARIELQVALASLLRRFPKLELAVPESDLEWLAGSFIRGVRSLPVRW